MKKSSHFYKGRSIAVLVGCFSKISLNYGKVLGTKLTIWRYALYLIATEFAFWRGVFKKILSLNSHRKRLNRRVFIKILLNIIKVIYSKILWHFRKNTCKKIIPSIYRGIKRGKNRGGFYDFEETFTKNSQKMIVWYLNI